MPPKLSPLKTLIAVLAIVALLSCALFAEKFEICIPSFIAFVVLVFIGKVVK